MVSYADVKSELDAKWNAAIIAEPKYRNGNLGISHIHQNFVFISVRDTPDVKELSLNSLLEEKSTLFSFTIIAGSIANVELFIREIRRIILQKYISGGWWRVIGEPVYEERRRRNVATLMCREIIAINTTSWN